MAPDQKKAPQRKSPKPSWLLGCFGFPPKPTPSEGKKARKSSGRRRWFRLCLPKIRVINVRRKKVSLDAKAAALKATQNIMLEASKMQQIKLHNHHRHSLGAQDQVKLLPEGKESDQLNLGVQKDESNGATYSKQDHKSNTKHTCSSKATKDSLIGVSIMLTTLVIMGIWGKLCAILCMSAWFYCVPLLRVARNFNDEPKKGGVKLELDSKLHKKKVVLEGLLRRDHKVAIAPS